MVRTVLELTVRQILHLFKDVDKYDILLHSELRMNTSNHNQFDTYFVTYVSN